MKLFRSPSFYIPFAMLAFCGLIGGLSWFWVSQKYLGFSSWKYIVVHHSASAAGNAEVFHKYHLKKGYGGLAYHFVIGNGRGSGDGEIEEGFRWKRQLIGTHSSSKSWNYNIHGIGIVLVGNFEKTVPTAKQLVSLKQLIERLRAEHGIGWNDVIGHTQVPFDFDPSKTQTTLCPGKHLLKWLKRQRVSFRDKSLKTH